MNQLELPLNAPRTREEWETRYPERQTRYLAWCRATHSEPETLPLFEFIAWIGRCSAAFCAERKIDRESSFSDAEQDAFSAWLWEVAA